MLVLASASPRRRELLGQVGLVFTVDPADIAEDRLADEPAEDYVRRIAEEKARAVFARRSGSIPSDDPLIVLGADTCVLLDGKILGKPAGTDEARAMLERLSGQTHQVLTGVAACTRVGATVEVEITRVTFDLIEPSEIERYLATGESLDKAGAYGIQGYAARWIPRVEGCFYNVVGLPLARTVKLLARVTALLAGADQDR